jgi:hypothetical protein
MQTFFKKLLLTGLLLVFMPVMAQKPGPKGKGPDKSVNLTLGKPFKSPVKEQNKFYLGTSQGAYYFLRQKGAFLSNTYSIDRVNTGMGLQRNQEIKFKRAGFKVQPSGSFQLNDDIYLLTIDNKQGEKYSEFVAQKLDPTKLNTSNPITLGSVNASVGSSGYESSLFGYTSDDSFFKIRTKPDSTGFMVLYNLKGKKSDNEKFGFNVFDAELKKKWSIEVELPYSEKMFDILDVRIDDEEAIYIVGKLYNQTRAEKRKGEVNYITKVYKFVKDKVEPESEIDIDFDDIYLSSLRLVFRADKITAFGFYRKIKSVGEDGVFVLNLNKGNGELIDYNMEPFAKNFFLMDLSDKEKKKTQKSLDKGKGGRSFARMALDYIIPQPDGGFIILAEQRYLVIVTTQSQNGVTRTDYHYYGNDIISFKVGADDTIEWYTKIPKRQHTVNNNGVGTSYVAIPSKDRIMLLYNEGHKAFDPKITSKKGKYSIYKSPRKGLVSMSVIDLEGNTSKVKLLDKTNGKFVLTPKTRGLIPEGAILQFFTPKEKRYGLVTEENLIEIGI